LPATSLCDDPHNLKLAANAVISSSNPSRISSRIWIAVPLCALGFLIWINILRIRQVDYVSSVGEVPAAGVSSPDVWQPRLIVPGHVNRSYEWLDQTRQMAARGEWRVRYIDYENAPVGRVVYESSPYRWWLGLVSWCDHKVSGRSIDQSIERAALITDPLFHLLLLVVTVIFVARQFGVFPAALLAVGLAVLFPFGGEFVPGAPEERGFAQALALWSVLLLVVGSRVMHSSVANALIWSRRWFFAAGVVGGIGLWISVGNQVPVIVGIAGGALIAAWIAGGVRQEKKTEEQAAILPWRHWAFGGAVTTLIAYLVEYFPSHVGAWEFRALHPLYGITWLGLGEVLARIVAWIQQRTLGKSFRDVVIMVLAIAAFIALPVVMWKLKNQGFLETDPSLSRLTKLSGGTVATSFWSWIIHEGITPAVGATFLPLFLTVPAAWLLARSVTGLGSRTSIAIALGPVLIALGFAFQRLSWWNGLDALLLVLLIAVTTVIGAAIKLGPKQWSWVVYVALLFLPGAIRLFPTSNRGTQNSLNENEVFGLIERDLSRWMAKHVGPRGALILAPHNLTTTCYYYGGLHGLATFDWENRDGLAAAMRIVSASTPEEAKELISRRGVTHIMIPSWDPYLDVYTRMGMGRMEGTFMNLLHLWKLPSWLRPVAYQLPVITGFEGQSVTILEVVDDEQDEAAELSRLAEYFVEMGQLDVAASVTQGLRRYPADLGANVARAQFEVARGEMDAFAKSVEQLKNRLSNKADRSLPWDRRVSLAIILMRGKQPDLAREQTRRCLADVDEEKLRSLSTGSLYRLQVLGKAFGLSIDDLRLRALALDLLSEDLRSRL
jgi:hypothetical protein